MSQRIALVGATGGLGKSVVKVLDQNPSFQFTLLVRSQPNFQTKSTVKVVDYSSTDSLVEALQGIDTVISFAFDPSPAFIESTRKLIEASLKAGVKRFIPSEWAGDIARFPNDPALYAPKVAIRDILQSSGLEYTLVGNGLFMDYLLPRGTKTSVKDVVIPVSVEDRKARIPGTGNETQILTYTEDIARGIETLLKQSFGSWKKYSWIIGERTTWNQILQTAEELTGEKFQVEYVSEEQLKKQLLEETDPLKKFYIEVDLWYIKGLDLQATDFTADVLAGRKTHSIKEVIERAVNLLKH